MLALFGQAFDNATGGCFRRSDEICSEAPPVCTALIWKFGDEVESHVSCRSAGLWPHFCLCSAVCLVRSHHAGLIRVIEYSWGQNNHLTEKWEIHSFHWETWSSQMHILETPDCTLTHTHTHSHSDYLRNTHTSEYSQVQKRVFVKPEEFLTCFCRC